MNETSVNIAKTKPAGEIIGFKKEIADIQTAIAGFEMGNKLNIAIIGEPYGGRTTLINEIEGMKPGRIAKVNFSSIVKTKDEVILPDNSKRIIILDHCEFLYMRKIGGFDVFNEVFKLLVSSDNLFITTWNFYSWNYLNEITTVGKYFPVQIHIPKFTTDEIKECILSRYGKDEIKFTEDVPFEKEKLIQFVKKPVTLKPLKKTINIPYIKLNRSILDIKLSKKEEKITTENIVFEKIRRISNGNPGVAKVVWKKSLEYPVIKPSKIKEFYFKIDIDFNESFILDIILSMNIIKKEELVEIAGPDFQIDKILFRLSEQGLITMDEGYCKIKPEALKSVVEFLKKSRMVW